MVVNLGLAQNRTAEAEKSWIAFEGLIYVKSLKRWVKAVIIQHYRPDGAIKNCNIFISTDTILAGSDVYLYYHLRFQIEFIYRNPKQHLGLNHCANQ